MRLHAGIQLGSGYPGTACIQQCECELVPVQVVTGFDMPKHSQLILVCLHYLRQVGTFWWQQFFLYRCCAEDAPVQRFVESL